MAKEVTAEDQAKRALANSAKQFRGDPTRGVNSDPLAAAKTAEEATKLAGLSNTALAELNDRATVCFTYAAQTGEIDDRSTLLDKARAHARAAVSNALELGEGKKGKALASRCYTNLGAINLLTGSYRSAAKNLEWALDSGPENAVACYNLGLARIMEGNAEEAAKQLRKAAELSGGSGRMADNCGRLAAAGADYLNIAWEPLGRIRAGEKTGYRSPETGCHSLETNCHSPETGCHRPEAG